MPKSLILLAKALRLRFLKRRKRHSSGLAAAPLLKYTSVPSSDLKLPEDGSSVYAVPTLTSQTRIHLNGLSEKNYTDAVENYPFCSSNETLLDTPQLTCSSSNSSETRHYLPFYQDSDFPVAQPHSKTLEGSKIDEPKDSNPVQLGPSSGLTTFRLCAPDDTSLHRKKNIADLRTAYTDSSSQTPLTTPQPAGGRTHQESSFLKEIELIQTLDHFRFFCILDTGTQGNPVVCASWGIWPVGGIAHNEQIQLNVHVSQDKSCEIFSDIDEDGNPVSYLALISKLLVSRTGESRLLLVSLLDVTNFLDAITVEDLEIEQQMREDLEDSGISPSPEDSLFETMSGCSSVTSNYTCAGEKDIWMEMANESRTKLVSSNSSKCSVGGASDDTEPSHAVRNLLDEFTTELLDMYKNFFILERSAVDDRFYEISHLSPSLHAEEEYVTGHLKHTPPDMVQLLSKYLGRNERFDIEINWGNSGTEKRIYCVPVYGWRSGSWICMLTDIDAPTLWRREMSPEGTG